MTEIEPDYRSPTVLEAGSRAQADRWCKRYRRKGHRVKIERHEVDPRTKDATKGQIKYFYDVVVGGLR